MLHENAKQRLWRMVPEQFNLTWHDPLREEVVEETMTLDPASQIRWSRQGSAPEYPCVYLNVNPQGEPRGDIGHIFEDTIFKEDHADPDIAYTKYVSAPQTATFTVTVAAKHGTKKIPKRVVADQLAIDTWHEFRFNNTHLKQVGVDPSGDDLAYAAPMHIAPAGSGMEDTSATVDDQAIERRYVEFDLEYVYFHEETVEAVETLIWRFGVDKDYDGEPEQWSDWHETSGSD